MKQKANFDTTYCINDKAISKKYSHTQFARECCIGILKELLNK